jgi:hypothetical protein
MSDPITLIDAKGRKLTVREMDLLQQMRFLRALGPQQRTFTPGQVDPYVETAQCVAMVSAIDGHPLPPITSEANLDAAIAKVGDDGVNAISAWFRARAKEAAEVADAAMEDGKAADPLAPSG